MKPVVVLVRPEHPGNVGAVCRAMKNFGWNELRVVGAVPKNAGEAKARSARARDVLENARGFRSLEKAVEGFDLVVATTARKSGARKEGRRLMDARGFAERFCKKTGSLAVVFGPETNGLTNKDLACADFLAIIPAAHAYPTLNLSHAVAIMASEWFLAQGKGLRFKGMDAQLKNTLVERYSALVSAVGNIERAGEAVERFRSFVSRGLGSPKEARTLLAVVGSATKQLEKNKQGKGSPKKSRGKKPGPEKRGS